MAGRVGPSRIQEHDIVTLNSSFLVKLMHRLISGALWDELKDLSLKSTVRLAAISYVTHEHLQFKRGDTLIVDASDEAIASGRTSAAVLERAQKLGTRLYSCAALHAKIVVFDRIAVIGSANMSRSSASRLIEASIITDHPGAVSSARNFIEILCDKSELIDKKFIERISRIKVSRSHLIDTRILEHTSIKILPSQTWIVGVHEIDESRYKNEKEQVNIGIDLAQEKLYSADSEVEWIRFTGTGKFRREAKEGDTVIKIWRPYSSNSKPTRVYKHAPIIRRQDEPTCSRFYIEEYKSAEDNSLTWNQFLKLIKRVGIPGRIGKYSERIIDDTYSTALAELWMV